MSRLADRAFDAFFLSLRGYYRVFAESPAAPVLSPPAPVRHTGFDQDLTVLAREQVAEDVVALTLGCGEDLPAWTPGAHLDVFLPSGAQRQYSLCGEPADRLRYRIAVRRIADGGGGSVEIHDRVAVGDTVRVRGPRQAFHLVPEESYLFVAGGIGITPVIPMVEEAARRGADWRLVYLGRSRETLPFLERLARYGDRVTVLTDDEHGEPDMARVLACATSVSAVYICGPTPLMDQARSALPQIAPEARFHGERFSAPPVRGGREFTIRLARSGREVTVAADESALTAIRREVPGIAYSCQQGFCGTCKLSVLEGEVEHRDRILLASERADQMLTCVSRGSGTVVLDR